MPRKAAKPRSKNWVVLVDPSGVDDGSVVEVCCGQRYATQAAAEKEAKDHTVDGDGWVAIAQIVRIGKASSSIEWKD